MAQRLIYHWKHGWIPLDHYAALQKAHGRESGASKIEGHLGITGEDGKSRHLEQGLRTSHSMAGEPSAPKSPGDTSAKVRGLPGADRFKGVHSETYRGNKITVRKGRQWGTLQSEINGNPLSVGAFGLTNAHAVRELDSARATVDHAHANPDSYTNGFGEVSYGMKLAKPADSNPAGKDARTMTSAQKIKAAEIMFGTGSKQHLTAKKRFGSK